MNLLHTLQLYKLSLTRQLYQHSQLLERYSINGYISKKNINGKQYHYLQYHNEDKELISVFFTDRIRNLYNKMTEQKKKEELRIKKIREDLNLLDKVNIKESEPNKMLPEQLYGFRLLNNTVGISGYYHAFFQIKPKKNQSEYEIVAFYKKKEYHAPMTYVNERFIGNIKQYIKTDGEIIDLEIKRKLQDNKPKTKIYGKTESDIHYKAIYKKDSYDIFFQYEKEVINLTYQIDSETDYDFHQIYIMNLIDEYIKNRKIDDTWRKYYG